MAARLLMRQRLAPVTIGAVVFGIALFPKTVLYAEPPEDPRWRKSIYDDFEASPALTSTTLSDRTQSLPKTRSPHPTERLAMQIRKCRLFVYAHVAAAEIKVNEFMDSALDLEESFTSTIASLAPAPQTGEKLMPGSIYVLVAAMTGSIASRNRNILIRASLPLAVGITAGWVILPVTMQNVSELLWKYEQRFPAIADSHIRTREGIQKAWTMAKIHSEHAVKIVDEKVTTGRSAIENWVREGK